MLDDGFLPFDVDVQLCKEESLKMINQLCFEQFCGVCLKLFTLLMLISSYCDLCQWLDTVLCVFGASEGCCFTL